MQEHTTEHAEAPAAAHGATTEAEGHGSGGLPQFDPAYWPGQIVWLLIIFVVLYVVLSKVLLPKVSGAIEVREGKIAGDIAEARRLKDEAEVQAAAAASETAEARSRSQRLAADAKAKANAEAAVRQAAEEAKLNDRLSAAEASIAAAREQAMGNVRTIAAETAQAIVEKLTGAPADAAEVDQALSTVRA
jgi:F-type H+-transporting ATPase subunit b